MSRFTMKSFVGRPEYAYGYLLKKFEGDVAKVRAHCVYKLALISRVDYRMTYRGVLKLLDQDERSRARKQKKGRKR